MRKLAAFVYNFRDYLTLFAALAVSLLVISGNNNVHVRAMRGEFLDGYSYLLSPLRYLSRLQGVYDENRRLRAKNVQIAVENARYFIAGHENQRLRELLEFKRKSTFEYFPAEVVGRHRDAFSSSIILNAGTEDGISVNHPCITSEGVVGKVIETGERTSAVQLLNDRNFRLSVKIMPGSADGILEGRQGLAILREVPKSLSVSVGDTVVTSGYSDIFPAGLSVGYVVEVSEKPESFFKDIKVRPSAELASLEEVFVIVGGTQRDEPGAERQ